MFLQNLPTHHWQNEEIGELLAEAFKLKFMFADAPNHLSKKKWHLVIHWVKCLIHDGESWIDSWSLRTVIISANHLWLTAKWTSLSSIGAKKYRDREREILLLQALKIPPNCIAKMSFRPKKKSHCPFEVQQRFFMHACSSERCW